MTGINQTKMTAATEDQLEERLERFTSQVLRLFEQHCNDVMKDKALEGDSQTFCSMFSDDSESILSDDDDLSEDLEEEDQDDDDQSMSSGLDDLRTDLDFTSDSLADLELEFSKDMEALALGLESAFEQFQEEDLVQLTKSTQSDFTASSSLHNKDSFKQRGSSKKHRSVVLIPVCLDDFYNNHHHQKNKNEEDVDDEKKKEEAQNWFELLWAAIEKSLKQQQQQQKQQQKQEKTTQECETLYRVWSRE